MHFCLFKKMEKLKKRFGNVLKPQKSIHRIHACPVREKIFWPFKRPISLPPQRLLLLTTKEKKKVIFSFFVHFRSFNRKFVWKGRGNRCGRVAHPPAVSRPSEDFSKKRLATWHGAPSTWRSAVGGGRSMQMMSMARTGRRVNELQIGRLFLNEFDIQGYRSIALRMIYRTSFEFELIWWADWS